MTYCQNQSLCGIPLRTLHNTRFICSDHFEDKCFLGEGRKRLRQNAVPTVTQSPMKDPCQCALCVNIESDDDNSSLDEMECESEECMEEHVSNINDDDYIVVCKDEKKKKVNFMNFIQLTAYQ